MTDSFGEFKIDKLEPGSGRYEVEVTSSAGKLSTTFKLDPGSMYLGTLVLTA